MENLTLMREEAKKQIEQQEEESFKRFAEFVDSFIEHDVSRIFKDWYESNKE